MKKELEIFRHGDQRAEKELAFFETLPPGQPVVAIIKEQIPPDFSEVIRDMSKYSPLDLLKLLKFFGPKDRVRLIESVNWSRFAEKISRIEKNSEASLVADAAREVFGLDNTINLALNYTRRSSSKRFQKAAIRLAGGMPLDALAAIFGQYANIARASVEWPQQGDDAWFELFFAAIHSLYISALTDHDNRTISEERASLFISQILKNDVITIAQRVKEPNIKMGSCGIYMIESIRSCMLDASAADLVMRHFGYEWVDFDKPRQSYSRDGCGGYQKI